MDYLLRQINTFTNRSNLPSDSLMSERYKRCEKEIDNQINEMKDILIKNHSIDVIKKPIDSKIKKECSPWFSYIDFKLWYEFGYDKTGKIKKCDDGQSIYHPTKKQIYELCDEIKIQKMIINPFYTHVNRQQRNKTFYIEF